MTVKNALIISTNYGTESDELTAPLEALQSAQWLHLDHFSESK